jgi:hypothetical protein
MLLAKERKANVHSLKQSSKFCADELNPLLQWCIVVGKSLAGISALQQNLCGIAHELPALHSLKVTTVIGTTINLKNVCQDPLCCQSFSSLSCVSSPLSLPLPLPS